MSENLKKFIFIFVILLVITAIILSILVWYKQTKSNSVEQSAAEQEALIPPLPEGSKRIELQNVRDKEEIRTAFRQFVKDSATQGEIREAYFVNDTNQLATLDDFSSAIDLNLPNNLKELLDQERYQVFSCMNEEKTKEFGFAINIRRFSQDEAIDYMTLDRKIKNGLADWEKAVLNDLHAMLFPQADFDKDQLNQKVSFKSGKYRYAEIILPDGTHSSINYGDFGGPIVFITSLECMDKATANFFDE